MPALRLVWIQQFYRDLDGARQEAGTHPRGDGVPPGRDRIVSPYDLDARYSVKRDTGWLGYKVHFTETCDPSEASTDTSDTTATGAGRGEHPNLITNVVTTTATVTDTAMTTTIHQQLADKGLTPTEHLVDSGYPWCPDPKPPAQLLDRPAPRPHPNHTPRPSRLHPRRLNTEPHHGIGHQGPPAAEDPGKVVTYARAGIALSRPASRGRCWC